ncbi:hypothetical protein AOQ84DRAFT_382759 [Glonium stellatum]|uniref:Uncharacterized protein n=1 Tax=Glonium stellatum TaxID=574774 RepID=A0A8E2JM71_9PEZI|nr:hypothetical protein AOQ84DRAFT_382759 [Glonium stellatum]
MQVAEILSDLASLGVCDHGAALDLISMHPCLISAFRVDPAQSSNTVRSTDDPELARAKDLVHLHHSVKISRADGPLNRGLLEARNAVRRAFEG